jgi:drug/metabolite transporter (DMT)-like permease
VLCVARPAFLFSHHEQASPVPDSSAHTNGGILPPVKATPQERTIAIFCSIFGSIAAATAYSTIRVIGKRAHSLVSVNYFATLATISSFVIITIHPRLHFEIPNSGAEWYVAHSPALCGTMANFSRILLLSIGVSGFMFQLLLTEGLQREKAGRATNLIVSCPILSS